MNLGSNLAIFLLKAIDNIDAEEEVTLDGLDLVGVKIEHLDRN